MLFNRLATVVACSLGTLASPFLPRVECPPATDNIYDMLRHRSCELDTLGAHLKAEGKIISLNNTEGINILGSLIEASSESINPGDYLQFLLMHPIPSESDVMGSGVSKADFENELKGYYNAMMPIVDSFKYYPGYAETMPLESMVLKAKIQNFAEAVEEDSEKLKDIFGLPSVGHGLAEIGQEVSGWANGVLNTAGVLV
ncbi:hypothetical protein FRC09_016426 [Ceratobasidium sp. 395]|nr:hypothetical protein FRC09_016426 [Ceratobasidium sp. 395]